MRSVLLLIQPRCSDRTSTRQPLLREGFLYVTVRVGREQCTRRTTNEGRDDERDSVPLYGRAGRKHRAGVAGPVGRRGPPPPPAPPGRVGAPGGGPRPKAAFRLGVVPIPPRRGPAARAPGGFG